MTSVLVVSEVPGRYSSGNIKWVVVCIGLYLSSCRRCRIKVISPEAREEKRSLRKFIVRRKEKDQ